MAGGMSGRGDGRGGRSIGRGFEDGRGGRPISLNPHDGCDSVNGLGRRPAGRGSGEGFGSGSGHGNLSYALAPALRRARTTQSSTLPPTLQRAPTTQSSAFPPALQRAPTTQSSAPPPTLQHEPTTQSAPPPVLQRAPTSQSSAPPPTLQRVPSTQSSTPSPTLQREPATHTPSNIPLAENELLTSLSTLAAETSLGDQTTTPSENASSSNSKPLLKIANKIFTPSHVASGQITKCIKQRFDKEGYKWSAVSQQTKEYYWNEFQKHFSFDRDLSVVREIFERRAAIRYSGILCEWRKSGRRPVNVPQETWDNWQQNWNTLEFKNKSQQASKNRLSEVAGQGNGPSTHSGGSRSAIDHSIILARDLGRPVTDYDVFVRMHKKKNGKFIDKRSEKVAEEVTERYNAAIENQTDDGENSSITVDLSAIYYEVTGPLKKKRVYGLGSKPSTAISDCSSSISALPDRDQIRTELYEEMREEMIKRQEEMEQQMREGQEHMELEWKKKQQEMEDLIQRFVSGAGPSAPPTDAYPTDNDYMEDPDLDEDE